MSIQPSDLATFQQREDGNLEVSLDQFGRLIVTSPHSGIVVDFNIRRGEDKQFHFFINTRASEDPKLAKAAVKANKGQSVGARYELAVDGKFTLLDEPPVTAETIDQSTGQKAVQAADEPAPEPEPVEETTGAS